MSALYILAGIMIALGLVLSLFDKRGGSETEVKAKYRYRRKDFFMNSSEYALFKLLPRFLDGEYEVFPQVHLSKLFDNEVPGQNWRGAFSHINGKSVDFVICDKNSVRPLIAIELDGSSHEREDRIIRDEEVDRIFKEAGLPLIRIKNTPHFNEEEIRSRINSVLKANN